MIQLLTLTAALLSAPAFADGKTSEKDKFDRIERIDGPAPFNRRLVLEDTPRGPSTYYGYDEGQTASPLGLSPVAVP